MKILMSALACEPGKGSELEVGFRALSAAASQHEVWVLTNSATIPIVREAIAQKPWADRVHLEGIYFDVDDAMYPQLTAPSFHRYYDRWQRKAAARAVELDQVVDFDVVHHVTLAANWTRAGVTALDKPLVWGPVGGGVEMPFRLVPELGWQGLLDEIARIAGRHVLVHLGPARETRRRAVVVFAQNRDTARVMGLNGRLRVLSNATSVEVGTIGTGESRRPDIVFAARLLPWKGGRLAVRSLRYVRHPDAVLRIFGEGPERWRIAHWARRWGVADRVRFEGRVPRDELLRLVSTAGVFLHPAFHDEAGLAVAEALALGTPVVCLDHGGPPELLRHWPGALAEAVTTGTPKRTAQAIAASIDRFLADQPPVRRTPDRAVSSFDHEILAAYEVAVHRFWETRHARVWAFPAGRPQLFAESPRALSEGVKVYGFGRRLPKWTQIALAAQVRIPGIRRLLSESQQEQPPFCGWTAWHAIERELRRRNKLSSLAWVHFRSQWGKQRCNMLGLDDECTPCLFAVIEPADTATLHGRIVPTSSFRVARCVDTFQHQLWSVRQYEPLPRLHRPAKWNPERIRRVSEEVSATLDGVLPKGAAIPAHWRPMHGDFVPWNLREDSLGQLWLLDWEDAGWGPPLADLVRYVVASHALGWVRAGRIADVVRQTVGPRSVDQLSEVASFWLAHHNLQAGTSPDPVPDGQRSRDSARAVREVAVFRALMV